MAYSTTEGRQLLLDALSRATVALSDALAAAGEAYEQLDEANGDRLEREIFGPLQQASAAAQRAHNGFAERVGLPKESFGPGQAGPPSSRARGFIDEAVSAIGQADAALTEAQDAPELIEVGDQQLRQDIARVRELIGPLPGLTREFVRGLGR